MLVSKIFTSLQKSLFQSSAYTFSSVKPTSSETNNSKALVLQNTHLIFQMSFKNHQQTKNLSSFRFKSLTSRNFHRFCKSQSYVDHYNNLKTDIKQKQHKLKELQEKVQMLRQISQMSTTDKLMQLLFSLFGQNYETKAIKQHKDILIDLRNVLEKRIEESSVKWEEPRKLILDQRQKKVSEFIVAIIDYESKMAEFIKKRQNNKIEHLADVNEGLVLTHKLLIKNIDKEGGVQIWPLKNQPFAESQHQAVGFTGQVPRNSKVNELVIHGWKLKEKVVRKAKVLIN